MENWGLVTYRETNLLFSEEASSPTNKQRIATVVAHELAHMVIHTHYCHTLITLLWPPYVIGQAIIFCRVVSFFFFYLLLFFLAQSQRPQIANIECRSEMCCWRLAANTARKKVAKNRHLGTIAQFRRAISSQLRHVSTIGKKLVKQQYVLHMSPQYGELRGATYIRQGGHHVGHWPTFLVTF